MQVWIIETGRYYDNHTWTTSVHKSRISAERKCVKDGFLLDPEQYVYLNDKEHMYRKIAGPFEMEDK